MLKNRFELSEVEIARRLSFWQREEVLEDPFPPGFINRPPRNAAVLIPLLRQDNAWHILFIRRTANSNDPHSGQVAFPGGGSDPGDRDAVSTALREANEELGLRPVDVRVLGRLMDFITVTSYRVTPIVASIPWPYPLVLESKEVNRAFTIPLDWLADPDNHEERPRILPSPYQPVNVIYFKNFDGETLWGASARFTIELIKILFVD
jgi:8-oxo-dGTP pyrophosphatase MutT (NUDIX family)